MRKLLSSDFYTIKKGQDYNEIFVNSIPTLYKYQTVSDYSLSNLDNREVWGTVPNVFNDPYDSICCYTNSEIRKAISDHISSERVNSYQKLFETNQRSKLIETIKNSLLDNINENYRQQYCVSCFSLYNDSEIMWGHYANNAQGFVTAYDGNDLNKCARLSNQITFDLIKSLNLFGIDFSDVPEDNLVTIMPIIYSNGKVNNTNNLIKAIPELLNYYDDICAGTTIGQATQKYLNKIKINFYSNLQQNNTLLYSVLCNKNKCWSYEQEWRIWAYNSNVFTSNINSPYVKIGHVPAKAIYLGEKISVYNRIILVGIAKKFNIPVYQMKTKMYKHSCKLQPDLIEY